MLLHSMISLHLATVKINIAWSFTIFRKLLFTFKHFLSHIQTHTHICTHSLSHEHTHKHVFSFTRTLYRTHAYTVLYISHSKKYRYRPSNFHFQAIMNLNEFSMTVLRKLVLLFKYSLPINNQEIR